MVERCQIATSSVAKATHGHFMGIFASLEPLEESTSLDIVWNENSQCERKLLVFQWPEIVSGSENAAKLVHQKSETSERFRQTCLWYVVCAC